MNTSAITPDIPARKPGLFINRNYGFLWLGQSISLMGDEIFDFTLLVWFAAILTRRADGSSESWAPLAVSGILVATAAPYFLVGPLAGVFVDRWDKRRTMLLMDLLRGLLIASLLLVAGAFPLPFFGDGKPPLPLQLGMTYAVVFLASSCSQFFNPSRLALIGDIVAEPLRPRATSLAHGSQSVALIVGPLLAAPLLVAFGVQWALTIDALSFVASFLAVLAVRAPTAARSIALGQKGHFTREFVGGLRFAFASRVLSTLVIAFAFAGLGFGAVHSLYVFFTQENLHSTVASVGLVGAVFGGGGVVGAILWAIYAQRIGVIRLFVSSLAGFGLALLLVAQMTSLGPGLVLFGLTGIAQAGLQVSVGPIVLSATPRELVGRVFAMLDPVVRLTELLASVLGGYLASSVLLGFHATIFGHTFGRLDTIFSVSALIMVSGGIYAMLRLRGVKASPLTASVSAEVASAGEQAEVAAGD